MGVEMAFFCISYSHKDQDFVDELKTKLEEEGLVSWTDGNIKAGEEWRKSIDNAIKNSAGIILVITPRSMASPYVIYEWAFAMGLGKPIIQLVFEETDKLHPKLEPEQHIRFTDPENRPWDELLNHLYELAGDHREIPEEILRAEQAVNSPNQPEWTQGISALEQMQHDEAIEALVRIMKNNTTPNKRKEATLALVRRTNYKDKRAADGLMELVQIPSEPSRGNVVTYLGNIGAEEAVPKLVGFLLGEDDLRVDTDILRRSAISLGRIGGDVAIKALEDGFVKNTDVAVRTAIIQALGKSEEKSAMPILTEILKNLTYRPHRVEAARAIMKINSQEAIKILGAMVWEDDDPELQEVAAGVLGASGGQESLEILQAVYQKHRYPGSNRGFLSAINQIEARLKQQSSDEE
jgi:hypothetical protein